jgi:hypothetical protein
MLPLLERSLQLVYTERQLILLTGGCDGDVSCVMLKKAECCFAIRLPPVLIPSHRK